MYHTEIYSIKIPDNTPTDKVFDKVLEEWETGYHSPGDGHTFIGNSSLESSEFLLKDALEIHQHNLEEFCTALYQKLDEKYDISVASVVDSTIAVHYKIGQTLHTKVIKAETIEKALNELESFFS